MKATVDLGESFEAEMLGFFAEFGITPTSNQIAWFIELCAVNGLNNMIHAHVGAHDIIKGIRPPESIMETIPRGFICPRCKGKIQINQSLQWNCKCKVWNYES